MDMDDLEHIEFRALGGADNIVVGDLSGTDVTRVDIDLRGPNGGGDGAADSVTVNATQGADVFGVAGDAGGISVFGLQAGVNIFSQEQANDRLVLNGLGGDDVINASSLEADGIKLTMNGGLGNDILISSEGDDLINGGDGNDTALMGAGNDTFVWNPAPGRDHGPPSRSRVRSRRPARSSPKNDGERLAGWRKPPEPAILGYSLQVHLARRPLARDLCRPLL